jgi:predicted nucleotidyltransferase component of viral defense system
LPLIDEVLSGVDDASGIDFSVETPRLKLRPGGRTAEGRIYYRGPRGAPQPARIKLDLSADEVLARPPVLRPIAHAFPDELPAPAEVRCYGFEELFAEKIRAMGERSRPRDLYDIVNLFRREDLRLEQELIRSTLELKCESKGIAMPTHGEISSSPLRAELEAEWANMLGHQLPVLPPFEQFWEEAGVLFQWLEGDAVEEPVEPIGAMTSEDQTWSPPPTLATWGRASLEVVRFAGVNHLLVELGYKGSTRLIEPYSLRRSSAGNLLLYGVRADSREIRCYRVDKISPRGRPPSRSSQPSQSSSGPRVACLRLRYAGGREPQGSDLVNPQGGLVRPVPPTSCAARPAVRSSGARRAQPRCANTKDLEVGSAQVAGVTSSGWARRIHSRRLAHSRSRPSWPCDDPPSR